MGEFEQIIRSTIETKNTILIPGGKIFQSTSPQGMGRGFPPHLTLIAD